MKVFQMNPQDTLEKQQSLIKSFNAEVDLLSSLHHPSIVNLIMSWRSNMELVMVMDLFDYSLRQFLAFRTEQISRQLRNSWFSEKELLQ